MGGREWGKEGAWRAHLREAKTFGLEKSNPTVRETEGPLQSSVIPTGCVHSEAKYKKRVGVAYVGQLSGDIDWVENSGEWFWRNGKWSKVIRSTDL